MKFTHECLRAKLPKLVKSLNSLHELGATANPFAVELLLRDFKGMLVVYEEHARNEDNVLFPAVRRYFPGLNPTMDHEVHTWKYIIILL